MRLVDIIKSWVKEEKFNVQVLNGATIVDTIDQSKSYQMYTFNGLDAKYSYDGIIGWIVDNETPHVTFDWRFEDLIYPSDPLFFNKLKRQLKRKK
jgi:hypothetical protein